MNTDASIHTNSHSEALYGTATFQVKLLQLPAQSSSETFPLAPISHCELFMISGAVEVHMEGKHTFFSKGEKMSVTADKPVSLHNNGKQPASVLFISWGKGFEPIPLAEVTETRPWGSFTVLKDELDYKLKQLQVNPESRLSLQRHQKREEHWLVSEGHPEVTLNDDVHALNPGEYIHIPRFSWHRIANPASAESNSIVEIIELQLGDYFGEDDIERQQDDYGRS